jgi:hypothetical protein
LWDCCFADTASEAMAATEYTAAFSEKAIVKSTLELSTAER